MLLEISSINYSNSDQPTTKCQTNYFHFQENRLQSDEINVKKFKKWIDAPEKAKRFLSMYVWKMIFAAILNPVDNCNWARACVTAEA